ncbi:MAG: enolase C-terminal domain-like protein [Armatimonadota bacterium]
MNTDIRVLQVETFKVRAVARTPLSFGNVVVTDLPIGYACATVENRAGKMATGWGAMFLMHLWSWPVARASAEARSKVICELFEAYARLVCEPKEFSHPVTLFANTEERLREASRQISARHTPGEEMPFLGALVAASPIDHAIHDAFGNANGIDSYRGYGPEWMPDLSRFLGNDFAGVYPSQFLLQDYAPRVPIFHLVGGLDFLTRTEVKGDLPEDGVPNSLDHWIERDGVFCLKVKLHARDLHWDLNRTVAVARIYDQVRDLSRRDLPERPFLTVDFNEQCESPEYVVEFLRRLSEAAPQAYRDLLYIEQPVHRDLDAHPHDMRPVSALKPVLVDESLTTVADMRRAMALGWSGIALKSCKCLSSDLLLLCAAELAGVPYAIQDLTNPSIAQIESVGLAARIHPIKGVEANSRQFFPASNEIVASAHPDLFSIRDGCARTRSMTGTGLGMNLEAVPGFRPAVEEADRRYRSQQAD